MKTQLILLICIAGCTQLRAQVVGSVPVVITSQLPPATLTNVSCRAFVGTSTSNAVLGFAVTGQAGSNIQVLVRGVGPALSLFAQVGILAQPVLALFDSSGKQLATNTGWGTNPNATQISTAFVSTGAFALPSGSADSALLVTLTPGNYTAVVTGLNNSTGLALIEVYGVPPPPVPAPPVSPPPPTTPLAGSG
jgi:hypothetical protein